MKNIKQTIQKKYGDIAGHNFQVAPSFCCGTSGCCNELQFSMIGDEYKNIPGHNPDADLGLGCGIPTDFAGIKAGDFVLDLGSGAGNDCFVASALVGELGKVTGIDFTEAMIEKANINLAKSGFTNINFVKGDIEQMPFSDNQFNVVISNCVLNLVPDKPKAFNEIFRVLQPGGHFCVSDVVIKGQLPEKLRQDAEMYVGCVSGALSMDEYLDVIQNAGFEQITTHKLREITIPENLLKQYLSDPELIEFKQSGTGIYSMTVSGMKTG
jgi:ubiquinone/menaquinone biosynthesis C-methylase UbiE